MRSCDCVLKRSGHLDTETSVQRGKTVKEHRKKNVLSSGPRESAARWTYLFECPQITLRSTCPNRNSSSFFKKKKNLSLLLHASFQIVRCHPSGLWPSSGSRFYPTFACHLRSTGMYCQFCLPMCSLSPPPLYPQGPRGLSQSPSFTSIRYMDTRYLQI